MELGRGGEDQAWKGVETAAASATVSWAPSWAGQHNMGLDLWPFSSGYRAKETHCCQLHSTQGMEVNTPYLKETSGGFPAPIESSRSHFRAAGVMDTGKLRIGLLESISLSPSAPQLQYYYLPYRVA